MSADECDCTWKNVTPNKNKVSSSTPPNLARSLCCPPLLTPSVGPLTHPFWRAGFGSQDCHHRPHLLLAVHIKRRPEQEQSHLFHSSLPASSSFPSFPPSSTPSSSSSRQRTRETGELPRHERTRGGGGFGGGSFGFNGGRGFGGGSGLSSSGGFGSGSGFNR
ncbi:unnamed protein product [Closterium sp. NIES-53]